MRGGVVAATAAIALACAWPRWSATPDGKHIAIVKDREIFVVDRDGAVRSRATLPKLYEHLPAASLAPDAKAVVCEAWTVGDGKVAEPELVFIDLETGLDRPIGKGLALDGWSPDGAHFAYSGNGLQLYERKSGRTRELLKEATFAVAWAPDGSALFTIEKGGRLMRVPLAGGVEHLADMADVGWIQAAPDGGVWVASAERGCTEKDLSRHLETLTTHARLRRWDPKTRELVQMSESSIPWMRLSPDGKRLVALEFGKGERGKLVLLAADGVAERVLHRPADGEPLLPFWLDPSTLILASADRDTRKVTVWKVDAATGRKTDWTAAYEALK